MQQYTNDQILYWYTLLVEYWHYNPHGFDIKDSSLPKELIENQDPLEALKKEILKRMNPKRISNVF
ncbi:hypothetical protein N9955_00295 [bacterium]|nr:hypothetical protein [bacterium]